MLYFRFVFYGNDKEVKGEWWSGDEMTINEIVNYSNMFNDGAINYYLEYKEV